MTKTTFINKLLALPAKQRRYLVHRINDSLREEKAEKGGKRSTNPNNPSPSGDPWWDDPENVKIVDAGLQQAKEGRTVRVEDSPVFQRIVATYGNKKREGKRKKTA